MGTNNNDYRQQEGSGHQNDPNQNTGNLGNENESQSMGSRNQDTEQDWDTTGRTTGSQSQPQRMGNRGNGLNDPGMENDNYAGRDRDINDSRQAQSRTFNENEETWNDEQRTGAPGTSAGEGVNAGTKNNDWDENDQMQRGTGRSSMEDEGYNASSHGRFNDEEQNRYGQEDNRRNREELE